ncbi:hypothetical protein AVEN_28222-1, partial [Araneus ventricosus]
MPVSVRWCSDGTNASTAMINMGGINMYQALIDQLDLLESQFDDIRATKKALQEWMLNVPPVLPEEIEDEIGLFNDELESISLKFYKVLGNMNLAENANVEQFKDAFEAYAAGGTSLPDKYYRKLQLLKHKI